MRIAPFARVIAVGLTILLGASAHAFAAWQDKVEPSLLAAAASGDVSFLIMLKEQADFSGAAALPTKLQKGRYVYDRQKAVMDATQPAVQQALADLGVTGQGFRSVNAIAARGGLSVIQAMASRNDVGFVYITLPSLMDFPTPEPAAPIPAPRAPGGNLTHVKADQAWALGYRGQGAVVAGADTGVDWTHPALQGKYRGWNGVSGNHNFNWRSSFPSLICLTNTEPCDDDQFLGGGHGSHTMGTMLGDDGLTNQIGMAPDAKWIACRNMEHGVGAVPTYIDCMDWFLAPTDLNGQNPDPDLSPDVVNNSWGCLEGCAPPALQLQAQAARAAGVMYVVSAGNDGNDCSTIAFPLSPYKEVFTVAAASFPSDNIAGFSSRGPVLSNPAEGTYRKPDITAPGVSVRSSLKGGGYGSLSGTSMSGPHVAGLVALVISANPNLRGNIDCIEDLIERTAVPKTTTDGCGGDTSTTVPNNTFGYGRIDALAAVQDAANQPPNPVNDNATANTASTVAIDVLANDVDPEGIPGEMEIRSVQSPTAQGGTAVIFDNGTPADKSDDVVRYTSAASFTGNDTFTYQAADGRCFANQATVTVMVGNALAAPTALAVDYSAVSGADGNGVFEPGETAVRVRPSWSNLGATPLTLTGTAGAFTGPAATYSIPDAGAAYGTLAPSTIGDCGSNCYSFGITAASRPIRHWDATFAEQMSTADTKVWTLHVGDSFTDSPRANIFYPSIETIFHHGITTGCLSGDTYCPGAGTLREQMAVFVLRSLEGRSYSPPACVDGSERFSDVDHADIYCAFIEEFATRGITSGCGGGRFCPTDAVLREQMAVFMVKASGSGAPPPACVVGSEVFNDVPAGDGNCPYIEELARRGVVSGCGGGNYCPRDPVTRQQMAVFLSRTFGLVLYGL